MAYSKEEINKAFNHILREIENGRPLRRILKQDKDMPNTETFYKWVDGDEEKTKLYQRACKDRADLLFDEILEIADDSSLDEIEFKGRTLENKEFVSRSKLRVDARKWVVARLNPKKYGDKTYQDVTVRQQPPLFKLDEE